MEPSPLERQRRWRERSTPGWKAAEAVRSLRRGSTVVLGCLSLQLFPAAASAPAQAPPDPDQEPPAPAHAHHAAPAEEAARTAVDSARRFLSVTHHADREQIEIALGPIDLPARMSHHDLPQLPVQVGTVPFDFTLHGYRIEIVDQDGEPVPQVVLHHFNLLDPGDRELFLPIMRRILAASHETKPQRLPGWLFGLPFEKGDPFMALTMLHNPTDRDYHGVRVKLIVDYERFERLPFYRIYPFHMDVMFPTGSKAFDLPPGWSTKSFEASPAIEGGIIGLGGHLHRYGRSLTLEDLTTGRVLYRVQPVVAADGHIEEVPVQRYSGKGVGLVIHPSHLYRVTATYFNPTEETIPDGGMGSVAGALIPLEAWPRADTDDPLYRRDYQWVLDSVRMGDHQGEHEHGTAGSRDPGPSEDHRHGAPAAAASEEGNSPRPAAILPPGP